MPANDTLPAEDNPVAVKPALERAQPQWWKDIESFLKWGAVAYAFGFLTVMTHTARLGIPVLQLIDPINIWIGAPLAIVVFFIDRVFIHLKRARQKLSTQLIVAREESIQLASRVEKPEELFLLTFDVLAAVLVAMLDPPTKAIMKWVMKTLFERLEKEFKGTPLGEDRVRGLFAKIVYSGLAGVFISRFITVVFSICLVGLACFVYVWILYPNMPQSVGGGRPMHIRMLVDTEAIPLSVQEFRDLASVETKPRDHQTGKTIALPVTLYYQTEHDYFVTRQQPQTRMIAVSRHAVSGIIF